MVKPSAGFARLRFACLTYCVVFFTALPLAAEPISYSWEEGGRIRYATLDETNVNGVNYVSLNSLADQIGAGFGSEDERVQIDLNRHSAFIPIGSRDVYGSLVRSELIHPIVHRDGTYYIATADVSPLFREAFQLSLVRVAQEPADVTARDTVMPDPQPDEAIEFEPIDPSLLRGEAGVQRIVLDPGHGGADTGVVGSEGLEEKALVLAVSERLAALLDDEVGATVSLTRSTDRAMSIIERARFAVEQDADFVVSLHAGASLSSSAFGFEIFYPAGVADLPGTDRQSEQSAAMAAHLEQGLRSTTENPSRGIRSAPLRHVPVVEMPGIVVELGCLTNPSEEALLATEAYQGKLAQGIADGIAAYAKQADASP